MACVAANRLLSVTSVRSHVASNRHTPLVVRAALPHHGESKQSWFVGARQSVSYPGGWTSPSIHPAVVPHAWNDWSGKGNSNTEAKKLVLLDRDGVVNRDLGTWVQSEADFELLPGAGEAIAMLNRAGHHVVLASNQSCVGRGLITTDTLDSIHAKMHQELAKHGAHIDKIYVAVDSPESASERRKPGPGMILEAMEDFGVEGADCVFVGDALTDMQAACAAKVEQRILVTCSGHGAELVTTHLQEWELHPPVHVLPPMGSFGGLVADVLPVSIHADLLSAVREMVQDGYEDEIDDSEAWVGDWSRDPSVYNSNNF
mmetsp:Transcript_3600/g.7488  ORF Transcript_3600/g.7488 Transcript_3600/m.7488 type:complete len:316 (-) Transcript_3600:341-1288(-)|eukprot:CAMPEP_0118935182 /NCGR_PEP_ID=MMETSP1169-20130426/15081_1 /TAXON_ID=36882 /ORGANISM="Pyramimonas obovata, Strain CCMP722" /LENGTH=315 /DNA_ID=CAMNT_0006878177 /DNA_START=164 /DNA_END=1111 /DNA_ORIENTATION=-